MEQQERFALGDTEPSGDCGNFASGIDHIGCKSPGVITPYNWGSRIEVYGSTAEHAQELRNRVFNALTASTVEDARVADLEQRNAELVEALARCRHQASYTIGSSSFLSAQLHKVRDIVNDAFTARRVQEPSQSVSALVEALLSVDWDKAADWGIVDLGDRDKAISILATYHNQKDKN